MLTDVSYNGMAGLLIFIYFAKPKETLFTAMSSHEWKGNRSTAFDLRNRYIFYDGILVYSYF